MGLRTSTFRVKRHRVESLSTRCRWLNTRNADNAREATDCVPDSTYDLKHSTVHEVLQTCTRFKRSCSSHCRCAPTAKAIGRWTSAYRMYIKYTDKLQQRVLHIRTKAKFHINMSGKKKVLFLILNESFHFLRRQTRTGTWAVDVSGSHPLETRAHTPGRTAPNL